MANATRDVAPPLLDADVDPVARVEAGAQVDQGVHAGIQIEIVTVRAAMHEVPAGRADPHQLGD